MLINVFTTILTMVSRVSLPVPANMPVAVRMFNMTLMNTMLNSELKAATALICILLKTVNLPVFTGFSNKVDDVIKIAKKCV